MNGFWASNRTPRSGSEGLNGIHVDHHIHFVARLEALDPSISSLYNFSTYFFKKNFGSSYTEVLGHQIQFSVSSSQLEFLLSYDVHINVTFLQNNKSS